MPHRIHLCLVGSLAVGCASPGHHHHHRDHRGQHDFKGADEWAKTFDDPARDEWQKPDEVVALLDLEPGAVVANLGAGTGYFLGRLSRAVTEKGQVLGLDVETDMVRYMTERARREGLANVTARLVPFDDPTLAAGSVDRVLVVDTWHHIQDRGPYAKKLADALRPGARLVIVDFTMEAERGPPASHRVSPDQVRVELQSAGLEVRLEAESLPDQYVIVGTKPLQRNE